MLCLINSKRLLQTRPGVFVCCSGRRVACISIVRLAADTAASTEEIPLI